MHKNHSKKAKICDVAFTEFSRRVLEICRLDDDEKKVLRQIDDMAAFEEEKREDNMAFVAKYISLWAELEKDVKETPCPVVGMPHPTDVMDRLNAEMEARGVDITKALRKWANLKQAIRVKVEMLERDLFNFLEPLSANAVKKAGKVDLHEMWRQQFRESLEGGNGEAAGPLRRVSWAGEAAKI